MFHPEKKMPVTGLTFAEQAAMAGAHVELSGTLADCDRAVIEGRANTPGEALAQEIAWASARYDRDGITMIDCGTVYRDSDGYLAIGKDDPARHQFTLFDAEANRRISPWWR